MGTASAADLIRWSEALAGIARTGLGFTDSLYERERFEEVLRVAADIRAAAADRLLMGAANIDADDRAQMTDAPEVAEAIEEVVSEWLAQVGRGVAGYVTPKVAVGAVVGNDRNEILLVQRADSGSWLYPTGWADVGYSASEVAVKEVAEETGIDVEPLGVLAVLDGLRLGFTRVPLYSIVFHCRVVGGDLRRHPLECRDVGWFAEDALPQPLAGRNRWSGAAFAAIRGAPEPVVFDPPRVPTWRNHDLGP